MKMHDIVRAVIVVLIALGGTAAARAEERVGVLAVENADGKQCALTLTISATVPLPSRTELAFEEFEHRHFLSKVSTEGRSVREIPLTQKDMEGELAHLWTTMSAVTPD